MMFLKLFLIGAIFLSSCDVVTVAASTSASSSPLKKKHKPLPSKINKHKSASVITKAKGKKGSTSSSSSSGATVAATWPCMDELDKKILKITIPMMINFMITPLVSANDLFWTNRMKNPLAVAGMAASNQVYQTGFWLASFLPSITSTLVSKENGKQNQKGVQEAVGMSLLVASIIALVGSTLMLLYPTQTLSTVLQKDAPAMEYAKPYLMIRALAFWPGLISLVGFSAFRGTLDVKTPFAISFVCNMVNCVLDPILIFGFNMGVTGNAMSTVTAEILSAATFVYLLAKRRLFQVSKLFKLPSWSILGPLIKGGLALQLRMIGLNLTFMAVARVTQQIDTETGIAAAAHEMALQTFQLGGVLLIAMSVVAQIVVANDLAGKEGKLVARATANRLMSWGLLLGCGLGVMQILALPLLQRFLTPMQDVRDAAWTPSILASLLQAINGMVFIGEGIMSGCGDFLFLAMSTLIGTAGCLAALTVFPYQHGVTGVWMAFGVFNTLRLLGVYYHQWHLSQIAPSNLNRKTE